MKDARNLLGINPVWIPHVEIAKWTFQTLPRNGIVLSVHSHEIIFTYYVILYDFLRYFIPKNIIFDYRMRLKMNEYNSFKIFIVNLYNNSTFCFSVESILMTLSDIFVFRKSFVWKNENTVWGHKRRLKMNECYFFCRHGRLI